MVPGVTRRGSSRRSCSPFHWWRRALALTTIPAGRRRINPRSIRTMRAAGVTEALSGTGSAALILARDTRPIVLVYRHAILLVEHGQLAIGDGLVELRERF